jgi:DNA-binding GntR family transcriptional regulator
MPFSETNDTSSVYERLLQWLFSGNVAPGETLTERSLARELGVSHTPVRESIREMVAHGLLVGGDRGRSVRTRSYTAEEIKQLSEFRSTLEGAAARGAAANATEMDIARMEMICDEAEMENGSCSGERWAQLEHNFHTALAEASHNERLIHSLKHLLTECHYVFYIRPWITKPRKPSPEEVIAYLVKAREDHRAIVDAIREKDADLAGNIAAPHIWCSGLKVAREKMALDLKR